MAGAARLLVTETFHLDPETRRGVDAQLVAARVDQMASRRRPALPAGSLMRQIPKGSVRRARMARKDRRVSLRPLPDAMAGLSAFLPVEQGVACWAALTARVDALKAAGDPRTRGQIAADTLVERLTGQATADNVDVEVQITVPVENLLHPDRQQPAEVHGFGPIPAGLADQIIGRTCGSRWWRRLFTARTRDGRGSMIVGGDPAARRFTGWLAKLITLRDRCCREPFCTAQIRHVDHIVPVRDGGPTSYDNGRGVCEHHNYLREMPGWQVSTVSETGEPHAAITTTPSGQHYLSRAPNPP